MEVEVQYASIGSNLDLPKQDALARWAEAALQSGKAQASIVIRIVDEAESRSLNNKYRGRDRPTNVLSFPFEPPADVRDNHLGDLVICAPVVAREASEQDKPADAHWAHMVVHGVLHLRGFDHDEPVAAEAMERLETDILTGLGYSDPYLEVVCG